MIIYWCMTVNGGNEMKALLLKTSVWLVLLFSAMGLWQVSNAAEQHTPMKAHAVTTIDKATTDKRTEYRQQRKQLINLVKKRQPTYQHQHREQLMIQTTK